MGLSFVSRSKDRDLVFSTTYLLGSLAPFPLPAGFPLLISLEKYGGLRAELVAGRQSHQKRPHNPLVIFSAMPYANQFILPVVSVIAVLYMTH